MKAREIMTLSPMTGSPNDSAEDVARIMRDNDCGAVPIANEETRKIIGIVTDRDLAVRGLAEGKGGEAKVGELMTASPKCCSADDDLRDVEQVMVDHQVRRVPIVDANGLCVGIVSQADIARGTQGRNQISEREVAVVVERISEPKRPRFDKLSDTGLEQAF